MTRLASLDGLIAFGLTFVFVAAGSAQEKRHAMPVRTKLSWDSPRMRELEKEWQLLDSSQNKMPSDNGKDQWGDTRYYEGRLIEKRLSKKDIEDLAASCMTLPVNPDAWGLFNRDIIVDLMKRLERDPLVELLSKRCPYGIGDHSVEFILAVFGEAGNRLKDPILVLNEAYTKCQIPEVRNTLLQFIRRGFAGHGIVGKDGADFVNNATQWYKKNQDHLIVNSRYFYCEAYGGPIHNFKQEDMQYFERKLDESEGQPLLSEIPASTSSPNMPQRPQKDHSKLAFDNSKNADNRTIEQKMAELQGTWLVTEVVCNGTPVPPEKTKGALYVIRDDRLSEYDPDGKKYMEYRIKLGSLHEPLTMDLIRKVHELKPSQSERPSDLDRLLCELNEEITPAIYELRGTTLWLCCASFASQRRPTSFDTKNGSRESLIILKHVSSSLSFRIMLWFICGITVCVSVMAWRKGYWWRASWGTIASILLGICALFYAS